MYIQRVTTNVIKKAQYNGYHQKLGNKISFGVGEDYGVDLDAPENPDPTNKPGFKRGLLGVITMLTFPISVPLLYWYDKRKEERENKFTTDMNYDNIEN